MNGPSYITLVLGTSDQRLSFLAWCADHVGETFSGPECAAAYGGSAASGLVGQLVQAGVLVDVSPPVDPGHRRRSTRYVTIEDDPAWEIVRLIVARMRAAAAAR